MNDEIKRKISETLKGRTHTYKRRKNISNALKGRKIPKDVRLKISKATKGNRNCLGKVLTDEHKKNISKGMIGHKVSKKTRKKLSKVFKNRIIYWTDKISKANTGKVGYWHGKKFLKPHKDKLREAKCGIKLSEIQKKKISLKIKNYWMGLSKDEKAIKIKNILFANNVKPNKIELRLYNIVNVLFPKEYKLNVKAGLILNGRIPDIINVNGQKKCIELFGNYWHRNDSVRKKKNHYKRLGWDCLVIWERELKNMPKIIKRLREFNSIEN